MEVDDRPTGSAPPARPGQLTSIVLAILVVLALLTGLLHSTGVLRDIDGYGVLLIHVGAGLLAIVPAVLHIRRRRIRPRLTDVNRRTVLRGGLLSAAAVGVYLAAEGLARALSLPGAQRRATGFLRTVLGRPGRRAVDVLDVRRCSGHRPGAWRLEVRARQRQRAWTVSDIDAANDRVRRCSTAPAAGRPSRPGPAPGWPGCCRRERTGTVTVISATGYRRRLPLTDDLLLATGFGGTALSPGHGAPLRLVVPGRRGFHWVKWVVRIEHDDHPWWWEPPLPLQ